MHVLNLLKGLYELSDSIGNTAGLHPLSSPLSIEKQHEGGHLPVVVWHGMGDYYNSESISLVNETLHKYIPDLEFYSIYIKEDSRQDQKASIVGDCMTQIQGVCEQLQNREELKQGFNALGFSQGGLFLRAAQEICDLPINNLITFGSPHNGFTDLPPCDDWLCQKRNEFLKGRLYDPRIQNSMVQAQYYRDIYNFDDYIVGSNFLKFVNNEFVRDSEYADNLNKLNRLVLVMFSKDRTLVPKESAWYFDTDPDTNEAIPYNLTFAYKQNLVGLQTLDLEHKLDFITIDGEHMEFSEEDLQKIASKYL